MEKKKTVFIKEDLHKVLSQIKANRKLKSLDETIRLCLVKFWRLNPKGFKSVKK